MSYKEINQPYREEVEQRYPLVMERIGAIRKEQTVLEPFRSYFRKIADYILTIYNIEREIRAGSFFQRPIKELDEINHRMFADILPNQYQNSYANPSFAVEMLGAEYGRLLCLLYAEIQNMAGFAAEERSYEMTVYAELFVQIYNCFEDATGTTPEEIKNIIYWFYHDYSDVLIERSIRRQVDPGDDFFAEILMNSDLNDLRYLYRYGCYIGENEKKVAEFLNGMPSEEIQAMADTLTEGYRRGFEVTKKDLSKKSTVDLYYNVGFERMMRAAVLNFEKMGLKPVARRGNGRMGISSLSPNEQYDYDHKADSAAYLDKAYVERHLECMRTSYEKYKSLAAGYAGPAAVDVFGQEPFTPVNKPENYRFNEKQQKLDVYLANQGSQITNQYIKGEERSFTIIAYPIPEIGDNFPDIFRKTIEINNLDYTLYQNMQQKIIDVLDQAEYVHILGKGENHTDLKVAVCPLKDPGSQTAFENCVADVNIPVGEVFTSPVLKGTNGILHVSQVFLNQLKYVDLELAFTDGMITSYHCGNFADEAENQAFLKENLLHHHDTLPMGEFAIGTNTTAYKMGNDYNIGAKLPILIAEKTGPHFAIGDTCYSWAEDIAVYNPDGKEIVARDNEISILRREDPHKAYYNCHTDITIPYHELDKITVVGKDGSSKGIIENGRFVLAGTERLNEPLDQQD